jgi:hypothetical protein
MCIFHLFQHKGLLGLWTCMPITYVFFNIALVLSYTTADWGQISLSIKQQREEDERQREEAPEVGGANGHHHEEEEQSVGLVPIMSDL